MESMMAKNPFKRGQRPAVGTMEFVRMLAAERVPGADVLVRASLDASGYKVWVGAFRRNLNVELSILSDLHPTRAEACEDVARRLTNLGTVVKS